MIRSAVLGVLQQARQAAPRAGVVLAASLAVPVAEGAPGDLDPAFADAGRLVLVDPDPGPAWSLELDEDGDGFLAGGRLRCHSFYECETEGFTQPFTSAGLIDLDYAHPDLPGTLISDTVRLPDGKVIGVGQTAHSSFFRRTSSLTVFRLLPDGALDTTFAEAGLVQIGTGSSYRGNAVVLEPDGRIVVAGSTGGALVVARLLPNGTLDPDFGNAGLVTGPENAGEASLVRVADGGYRVTTMVFTGPEANVQTCRIVALTADGTLDSSFGTGGIVDLAPDVGGLYCTDLALQPDERLLVTGSADNGSTGLLVRLVPDGSPDDTFAAPAISEKMTRATAVALDAAGRVLVAGQGPVDMAGALVARLGADGALDTTYGNTGTTWIDLPSPQAEVINIIDMVAGAGGSVTVAGGYGFNQPFAARLSGNGSPNAAGIISMSRTSVSATEGGDPAIVTVRRSGGKSGLVRITYRTSPIEGDPSATPIADYEEVTGELTWADGDTTDREIPVAIASDGPEPEGFEYFLVKIDSSEGAAGLGGQATTVEIGPDGAPAGQFLINFSDGSVQEGQALDVYVDRAYFFSGEVSVSLQLSGTATEGTDYEVEPTVLTWLDGEQSTKIVQIRALTDNIDETAAETVTLTLTNPSGGAIIGASSSGSASISDPTPPPPPPPPQSNGGGGGSFGWASLLALCAAGLRRFAPRDSRCAAALSSGASSRRR